MSKEAFKKSEESGSKQYMAKSRNQMGWVYALWLDLDTAMASFECIVSLSRSVAVEIGSREILALIGKAGIHKILWKQR